MGRPALAIGGIALIAIGVATAFGFSWWHPSSSTTTDSQLSQHVDSVRIDLSSGDARVRAGDVTTTTVRQEFHYRGSRPGDAFRIEGGTLMLGDCGHNCSVDYDVLVPRGTSLTGTIASGDTTAQGLAATTVSAKSGDVRVLDATGPVRVQSNSGDIVVNLTTPQDVQADATSGDVRVTVPDDRYHVAVETRSGDQQVQIPSDPAGTHTLALTATSGDVSLSRS